jgi:heme/copper-type cytochrome/quinol oxidase subunit 2
MISAYVFYKQNFFISFQVSRGMYYYLLYFVLFALDLKIKDVEKLILIAAFLYCIAYLGNLVLPDLFFSKIVYDQSRFLTRVYLPGSLVNIFAYFYSLMKLIEYKEQKYLFFILLSFTVMILTGSRMVFIPVMLVTVFIFLRGFKFSRIFNIALIVTAILIIIFAFSQSFDAMLNLAKNDLGQQQQGGGTLNIRLEAVSFFYPFFFPDYWHLLMGNGFASTHSSFGQLIDYFKLKMNLYQSDIGILGDFTKMGLVYLFGVLILLKNVFTTKLSLKALYIKYFFYYVILSFITLSHFGYNDGIVTLCLSFYLIEKYNYNLNSGLLYNES